MSFKIEDPKEDYLIALFMGDDELLIDLIIPTFVAIAATIINMLRRRMSD